MGKMSSKTRTQQQLKNGHVYITLRLPEALVHEIDDRVARRQLAERPIRPFSRSDVAIDAIKTGMRVLGSGAELGK